MRNRRRNNQTTISGYEGIILSALVIVVALGCAAFFSSDERKYVSNSDNQCKLEKKITRYDLDRVYCGKACRRDAVEYTYWCDREKKNIIFVE